MHDVPPMKRAICMFFLTACQSDQQVQPPTPPVTTEAGVPAPASPTRTVGHRSPFGDAFQSDNMMVDGDFEITGRGDQAPWQVFTTSQQTLNYETGGHCRSGVRCAIIVPSDALVGYMTSPSNESFEIRAYAKPDGGHCADAQVYSFDVVNNNINGSASPTTQLPDADGWCFYDGIAPPITFFQPALYIQITANSKSKTLIVDQVSVLPVSKVPVHGITPPPQTPSAELQKRVATLAAYLRAHRKYGRNVERETP
jgi:hypothetical protein